MSQPVWITPAGSLGTWPEGVFYRVSVLAESPGQDVFFRLIAGELPAGVQLTATGAVEGTPKNITNVQGVPREVGEDVTSRFAVRAYTTRQVGNQTVVDRLADRTFTITITGQDLPEFVTPPGQIAQFYDGTKAEVRVEFSDPDPDDIVRLKIVSGELPPGLALDPRTGVISGVIFPLVGPPGTALAGYDRTQYDEFAFDFTTRAESRNFEFTVGITDGKETNLRTFSIYVYATDTLEADNIDITSDNTFITADASSRRAPLLLTPTGTLGRVRADNYFAFQFQAVDWDGDPIEFIANTGLGLGYDEGPFSADNEGFDRGTLSLPPGLQLDTRTGWLYGYIPDQLLTETTYQFAIQVRKIGDGSSLEPGVSSAPAFFSLTVIGDIETDTIWITDSDLGIIDNGAVSALAVRAKNLGDAVLQYQLAPGADNRLPQGLTLQPSGNITGRVSFNTFALDGGSTTFDINANPRLGIDKTTFDLKFDFTVNAFAATSAALGFEVKNITVTDGGGGYDPLNPPTIIISAPPATENSIQATAGAVTIVGGVITAIAVGNPGRGYTSAPTITIGGSGGATATAQIQESSVEYAVSVFRRFSITVDRRFNEPYETLYIKAMPPLADRARLNTLLDATAPGALIPYSSLYRPDDPNFGIATSVVYDHAYGLSAAALETYVQALDQNHYWKDITLGPIRTAQALDAQGEVLYEVVYSEIIDNLVNDQGVSVDKSVDLAYTIDVEEEPVSVVYPNSLINMRDQIIDTVGQVSPALPLWMTSKQPNNQVLGFTPAWVIAYVRPGESGRIAYNLQQNLTFDLNTIDYEVDRYEIDRSQTYNWNPSDDRWIPYPAESTTFDKNTVRLYQTPALLTSGRVDSVDVRTASGTDTQFTVAPTTVSPRVIVTVNGLIQTYASTTESGIFGDFWITYAFNSFTVQFVTAPASGSQIQIYQITDIYVNNAASAYETPATFDQGGTTFNSPADRWRPTDEFDKYLVFPKRTIIG